MQGDFKSPVAIYQQLICKWCTEEHNQLFEGLRITTDSMKIFSTTFRTLATVYLHLQNGKRCFQNCALCLYNCLHAVLCC